MKKVVEAAFIVLFLPLLGAGCVFNNTKKVSTNYPAVTTTPKDYYVNRGAGDNLSVPFSEWQKFYQKKYGWEFSYPEGWLMRTEKTEDQLLVFLSNVKCVNQCPPEYVGFKMKVGLVYTGNFLDYIKEEIERNNELKIYPGGQLEIIKISGKPAIKVSRSDWVGAEAGPGYFVVLDNDYYAYISTGRNNFTKNAEKVIGQLINSIKIYPNSIPRPNEIVKINKNNDIISADNGNIKTKKQPVSTEYISRRYRFTLHYPEHCFLSNQTDQTQWPIVLELALCGNKPEERVIGVRVFHGNIDAAWFSVYNGRNLSYQMQKVLVSDQPGRMYTVNAGPSSRSERWLLLERNGYTYIIYVIDDSGRYANDFDSLVFGFNFN